MPRYLPSKIRVFTDETGAFKPEILKEAMSVELDGLDRNKVLNLLDKQDNVTDRIEFTIDIAFVNDFDF